MTSSFIMDYEVVRRGTLNKNEDSDIGYTVEFRIPWASLGIQPHNDYHFKIDLCVDDIDTLVRFADIPGGVPLPQMSFQSATGTSDYGFPKNWQSATLYGEPSAWHRLQELRSWPVITVSVVAVLITMLALLGIRNHQLRQIPRKAEEDSRLAHFLEQEPPRVAALLHQELFSQTREIVLQQLNQDLSPAALAAQLFVGLRQLQRVFKEELQTTPNAFIISIKMEEAARRLTIGNVSVAELTYALGFSDPTYFARVFRKYFNCSPTNFAERKMNQP